ncbi:MAG: hypothetical protein JNM41_03905 [Flavipsychrobacter sp.]|nr:hypothetical protein [Flavipsychrobacter sp.]
MKYLIQLLLLALASSVSAQNNAAYLKANAIRVGDPYQLNDSIYNLLSPFQAIMVGEMHGTKEPAQFVVGLAKLFADKGDSVSVGLEIPESKMAAFLAAHTDSSLCESEFFKNFSVLDGRQSFAWAGAISHLKNNPRVQLFFFDINENVKISDRDSLMYVNIRKQAQLHPSWRVITLSGNAHTIAAPEERKTASYLKQDKELNLSGRLCTIGNYYQQGVCNANFGHGIELRKLGRPINDFDTTFDFERYFLLMSPKTTYPYTAMYYTKNLSPSEMVKDNFDRIALKKELKAIYERDQKTRKGDSAAFMSYIDSCNLVQIEPMIAKYGWIGKSLLGGGYNVVMFAVIQHAELPAQKKYLPLLRQSVEEGESEPYDLAMLEDRILMREGKNQIYGSQVVFNKQGAPVFYPIDDEKHVNVRRQKVGLEPLEEYAKHFGIDYKAPAE